MPLRYRRLDNLLLFNNWSCSWRSLLCHNLLLNIKDALIYVVTHSHYCVVRLYILIQYLLLLLFSRFLSRLLFLPFYPCRPLSCGIFLLLFCLLVLFQLPLLLQLLPLFFLPSDLFYLPFHLFTLCLFGSSLLFFFLLLLYSIPLLLFLELFSFKLSLLLL